MDINGDEERTLTLVPRQEVPVTYMRCSVHNGVYPEISSNTLYHFVAGKIRELFCCYATGVDFANLWTVVGKSLGWQGSQLSYRTISRIPEKLLHSFLAVLENAEVVEDDMILDSDRS